MAQADDDDRHLPGVGLAHDDLGGVGPLLDPHDVDLDAELGDVALDPGEVVGLRTVGVDEHVAMQASRPEENP